MGEHEGWPKPNGLLPNGLLPNECTSVIRVIDEERWSKAEDRTAELIARIQPNQPSEGRRNAVAEYVQRLIMRCFPCQVFTFGSVPLKTYLPDGDIDLTAFSKNQSLKDTWASQVRDILESEEKNENAEFHVKEVQYIQAEVKIIKCLVENIVVDISFNQLGGLCTLCFLEEVDHLINQNHLFKQSIILIKAWCYYESRILGAHHGLISTYALETLVLYIFHVFNNSFFGPLEVLYRFLDFFSNFDWDNFCVSLWGPVSISSLPDVTAESPRKDGGELLLSKLFLDACSSVYAVFPGGQDNQGQPFITKHFNIIDPLRVNNNLGRSVNKGNYYRIRSAFAFGAKRLARLLDCPKENIVFELNQFFMNTLERHGSGIRPDAPSSDLCRFRPSDQDDALDNQRNASCNNKTDEKASCHEIEVEASVVSHSLSFRRDNYLVESNFQNIDFPAVAHTQGQTENDNSNQSAQTDRKQISRKPEQMVNESQGRYLFTRTRSSPELTDSYCDASFKTRRNNPAESGKTQMAFAKMYGSPKKIVALETVSIQSDTSSPDDLPLGRPSSSHCMPGSANGLLSEDRVSMMSAQGMQQEEQDLVNMMASSSLHHFAGHIPLPMNMSSTHLPLPFSQSVLASMGYAQRTTSGMVPANIPLIDPYWAANLQFHQGMMSSPMAQYFPGIGLPMNSEDLSGQGNKNFASAEMIRGDSDTEYWREPDGPSNGGLGYDDACFELHADEGHPSTSANLNFIPSSQIVSPGSPLESERRFTKENSGSMRDDHVETFQQHDSQINEVYDRVSSARFSSASQSGSVRSKTSSESSWDGSSGRVSKAAKDKRGRKATRPALAPSNVHGKGKNILEHATTEPEDEERDRDWNNTSAMGNDIEERSISSQPASALHVSKHDSLDLDGIQTSGSDSIIPFASMVVSPGSRQRGMANSGIGPYTFYPTGPPVPFLTMLPVYNFPTDSRASDASSKVGGEEGPDNSDSGQNFSSTDGLSTYSSVIRATSTESPWELKRNILNSDFASHWQNLQFGRFCQGPRYPAPCPSPVVPPMYLQGRFPWDGPGRPLGANANNFPQVMNYGPHLVPVAPLQSVSNRPTAVFQQYVDELPRHRSGTGTYLPNPKASVRERHSSGTRRNSFNYDRSDHADREGNWNTAKARASARSHKADKSRIGNRPWMRHEPLSSYQSYNGQMAYGMYPGSNGQSFPSVVMLYPHDHNTGYVSPNEQLEFGSLGPVGFIGMNDDASQPAEVTQSRLSFVDQRNHRSSTQQSSREQPSSPPFHRSVAQRNYQLKDEDFPPLVLVNQRGDNGRTYDEKHSHHHTPLVFASQA